MRVTVGIKWGFTDTLAEHDVAEMSVKPRYIPTRVSETGDRYTGALVRTGAAHHGHN